MTLQVAKLHEAFVALLALEGSEVIMNADMIVQVAHLLKGCLTALVLTNQELVKSVCLGIHLLDFIVLTVVSNQLDFVTHEHLRIQRYKINIHGLLLGL